MSSTDRTRGAPDSDVLRALVLVAAGLACSGTLSAQGRVSFDRDVRPLLSDRCYPCHGPDGQRREANMRLDTYDGLFERQGSKVPMVIPGRPDRSLVWLRVSESDPAQRMPPTDSHLSLSDAEIATLRRWIDEGASWSPHWSLIAPLRPLPPSGASASSSRNAIDGFIEAELTTAGLEPAPEEQKGRLLRRLFLDLTGLPPTLEDLDRFEADSREVAFEDVVDRLLASPAFGERMAWNWLDAARYADTNGFQGDRTRTMWPWRDGVVAAWNDNIAFDQFTIAQLAGDLLPAPTLAERVATGFLRNHMINGEGGRIPEENRVDYVFDQLETVGTTFMGLTLNCCRCHDHKFDPIKQREYFALTAFFNQTPVTGGGDNPETPPVVAVPDAAAIARLRRLREEIAVRSDVVRERERSRVTSEDVVPASGEQEAKQKKERAAALERAPESRSAAQLKLLAEAALPTEPEYAQALTALRESVEQREAEERAIPKVMVMEDQKELRPTFVLRGGVYSQRGEEVVASVPACLPPLPTTEKADRLGLARWLMDRSHPLTARVAVNQLWAQFFGVGLVKTAADFGAQGEKPSHPELLDWLAVEFRESGFDRKALIRLIVTSHAYRQAAGGSARAFERDPENRLLSRGPRVPMPSWMLRDHALFVGGLLVQRLGGAPVFPYQPEGVWEEMSFGNLRYRQGTGEDLHRRSLYTFWRRIVAPTTLFNTASRKICSVTEQRTRSPLHALTTLNDVTFVEAARSLAERVLSVELTDELRVGRAFRMATARRPTERELSILSARLANLKAHYRGRLVDAAALVAVGEAKRRSDLDVVEHAAWTALCSLILNLDEALTK